MSTLNRPAEPMHRDDAHQSTPEMARKVLLACGILAALLYAVAHDALAAILYQNYSPFSQTISELGSIGAPTRPAVTSIVLIHEALLIAFGIGIWQSGRGNRALRVTGALLIVYGAIGPLWLPFPITARGEIATAGGLNDVMHVVLGAVTILLELSIIGFGAVALGRSFRLYSILTCATVVVFWAWSFMYAPALAAGEPTPWLGVVERIALGAWLLWLAVLAIVLLFGHQTLGRTSSERGASVTAHGPDHAGRVGADRVIQEERPRRSAIDRAEDGERAVEVGAPTHLAHPRRLMLADDPRGLPRRILRPSTNPSTP